MNLKNTGTKSLYELNLKTFFFNLKKSCGQTFHSKLQTNCQVTKKHFLPLNSCDLNNSLTVLVFNSPNYRPES